jgi:hypothetical protein
MINRNIFGFHQPSFLLPTFSLYLLNAEDIQSSQTTLRLPKYYIQILDYYFCIIEYSIFRAHWPPRATQPFQVFRIGNYPNHIFELRARIKGKIDILYRHVLRARAV